MNSWLKLYEQCQFLLHIISQLKGDNNKAISWNKINMPGRTTKSLQNMWTKINKTISEMEAAAANGEEIPKETRKFPSLIVSKTSCALDDGETDKNLSQLVSVLLARQRS